MISYIIKRLILSVITMIAVSIVAFIIMQAPPGDYVDHLHNTHNACAQPTTRQLLGAVCVVGTPEERKIVREILGLDQPLIIQYWNWIKPIVFHLDFGFSARPGGTFTSAAGLIKEAVPPTVYLTLMTILITWTLAIPIGIYSAARQNSVGDYVFTLLGFTGLAVPDFLLALVVMYLLYSNFEYSVGTLHSGTYQMAPWSVGKVLDMIVHLLIPAAVLGTAGTAGLIRIMRNNLLDELTKPYVITAQAKGISYWKLIIKYPLRVAINPFISGIGFILPSLISGSVILSVVVGLPTLGPLMLGAMVNQDVWLASDIILILGGLTVIGTLISDLMLAVVDPRIKLS